MQRLEMPHRRWPLRIDAGREAWPGSPRRRTSLTAAWLAAARIVAAGLAALCLAGCFSMGPVPPAPELEPVSLPDMAPSASFAATAGAEAPATWGADIVFIRPRLNGRDVGWFIFDTGASACTITAEGARRAGLPAVGRARLRNEPTTVYRCDVAEFGPLTLRDLPVVGLEMRHASLAFGQDVVGICGRDVCAASVVELDARRRQLLLHDPAAFVADEGIQWHPITVNPKTPLPLVRCRYRGGDGQTCEGLFVIDTGSNGCVHLFGSATERCGINLPSSARRRTQITYGAQEKVVAHQLEGFSVGDQELGTVEATFGLPGDSPSTMVPEADGMLGMELFERFVLLLDEPRQRVALVPRRDETASEAR